MDYLANHPTVANQLLGALWLYGVAQFVPHNWKRPFFELGGYIYEYLIENWRK